MVSRLPLSTFNFLVNNMEEFLDIVNDEDEVIGRETREAVHTLGLQHRGAHVLLFAPSGELIIQKRSALRKAYASLWDCSISEHVQAGEDYESAAQRGLREELGLDEIALRRLVTFRLTYGPNDVEISTVFEGSADPARVRFDADEVAEVELIAVEALVERMGVRPQEYCGWFIEIMRLYLGRPAGVQVIGKSMISQSTSK